MEQSGPVRESAGRGRFSLGLRCALALALGTLLLAGAVPERTDHTWFSYLLIGHQADRAGTAAADSAARRAGGTVVRRYPQIGTVLAYAETPEFARRARRAPGVAQVGATRTVTTSALPDGASREALPESPAKGPSDGAGGAGAPREADGSWNLSMLGAARPGAVPAPRELRRTVVAVLDSGVDDTHHDLHAAVDPKRSAACADGVPDPRPGAWRPTGAFEDSGHGTHVAGTIAAARDGAGVVGIAPGVRIAAVRLLGESGQYYAENLLCGFLWAADHGARVINSSYFADPWKYNCPEQPDQAAIITAVGRAVRYAQNRGALVVASAGNDGTDLAAPREDGRSPNDHPAETTPPVRVVGAECIRLPGQLPGVVQVAALDRAGSVTGYSNYNTGPGTVAAPGGDPDGGGDGQIVSSWPGDTYRALSGTSMAAANASGVAAILAVRHPGSGSAALRALLTGGPAGPPVGSPVGPVGSVLLPASG